MSWRVFSSHRSLERSFALSTALLVVGLVSATLFGAHSLLSSALHRGLEARGTSIARSIGAVATPSLLAYNYPALQISAEAASADPGVVYVVIHDKEGADAGVAGTLPPPARVQPTAGGPAIHKMTLDRVVRDDAGRAHKVLEVEVPVRVEGADTRWGAVRVGLANAPVAAELRRLVIWLALLGLAIALGAMVCGRFMARRITAPLRQLVRGTEALSAGAVAHRIPARGARELADLARAFNRMADRIEEKAHESSDFRQALEKLNATLENQVWERTQALQESEAQYKTLVEHSPDSILIVQDGRVHFVNRAFSETFGIAEEDALSDTFDLAQVFDRASAALARDRIAAWQRGDAASPAEVQGTNPSGRTRHLELRGSRIEFHGRPAAECLLVDMTETRRLHERLAETEKLRALGELASGVAHDFNNLLAAILGRAQLLLARGIDSSVDHDLRVIEKAAQDGRETVRRILEFSRVRRDLPPAIVDLAEVIKDALEITRARWKGEAEQRNAPIEVIQGLQPVPPVLGSAAELREVFTNLILNAVDAMPAGGKLVVNCRPAGESVIAEVSDDGVGMNSETRRKLFDPFFTTKGARGMGLGMSVVYGIVTRHGGKIEVASKPGQGTALRLEFAAAQGDLPAAETSTAPPTKPTRPGRVLVIDDEPEIRSVLRDALTAGGHSVDVAASARHGVELATSGEYDLVLTDLGMPDMSGWEVAERISQIRPGMPVALVTGWGTTLDAEEVRRRGIDAVVHKPFDLCSILNTAAELVALADARRR